jgi:ATP-dependent DNA helicase RecG
MVKTILAACSGDFLDLAALADLLDRSPDSLRIYYLNRMVKEGQLELRHPGKPTHPDQGYRAKKQDQEQEARK